MSSLDRGGEGGAFLCPLRLHPHRLPFGHRCPLSTASTFGRPGRRSTGVAGWRSRPGRDMPMLHSVLPYLLGPLNPLGATLMDFPVSAAKKRFTVRLNSLDATLTENKGGVIVNQISGVSRRGGIWTFRSKLNWRCGAEIPTWSGRGDVPFPALLFCSSWAGLDPCLGPADTPKELHAIPSTESHPQYGLLQAHALVAIPSGRAAHLFLPRIARRHV